MNSIKVCLSALVCMWIAGVVQAANMSTNVLERRINTTVHEKYFSDETRFLMAIAAFQQHAYYNELETDGSIQGVLDTLQAYERLHSTRTNLYVMKMYERLLRQVARGGAKQTMADYMLGVVQQKIRVCQDDRITKELRLLEEMLIGDKKNYTNFNKVIKGMEDARAVTAMFNLDTSVAAVEKPALALTSAEAGEVNRMTAKLLNFGKLLSATPENLWPEIVQTLQEHPFVTRNGAEVKFPEFLAAYGRFHPIQKDGVFLSELGHKLMSYENTEDE